MDVCNLLIAAGGRLHCSKTAVELATAPWELRAPGALVMPDTSTGLRSEGPFEVKAPCRAWLPMVLAQRNTEG